MIFLHAQRLLLCFFALLFLSGCVTAPVVPEYSFNSNEKVAIVVDSRFDGIHPSHTHVGTTVFQNFHKEYDQYSWDMKAPFAKTLELELKKQGINAQIIDDPSILAPDVSNAIVYEDDKWAIKNPAIINKLKAQGFTKVANVSYVEKLPARLECGTYSCHYRFSQGMGLFTRGSIFGADYMLTGHFDINILNIAAPSVITSDDEVMKPIRELRAIELDIFPESADFTILEDRQIEFLEKNLNIMFKRYSRLIVKEIIAPKYVK